MKFFIVTPSFNQINWLRLCIASVADQVTDPSLHLDAADLASHDSPLVVHHHIQDGASTDGTREFLSEYASKMTNIAKTKGLSNYFFSYDSSSDCGMYDAINKGWKATDGNVDIVAYLNCDEQYLPNTLKTANDYFSSHKEVDLIFGDALLVGPDGELIAFRKGYHPRWRYIATSHLYVLSCTMFLRKHVIDAGYFFKKELKAVGDSEFVIRVLKRGYRPAHIKRFFSAFTITRSNLGDSQIAKQEVHRYTKAAPWHFRCMHPFLNTLRLIEKMLSGAYFVKLPISYSIFTCGNGLNRRTFIAEKASFRWPKSLSENTKK